MIWAALFLTLSNILTLLIRVFPLADQDIVDMIELYVGDLKTVVNVANYIMDVDVLFSAIGFVIGIEMIFFAFKVIRFIAASVPFSPLGGSR